MKGMKDIWNKIIKKIDAFLDFMCIEDTPKRRREFEDGEKDESATLSGLIQEFGKQMKESSKK
jgi:hypothetical protein